EPPPQQSPAGLGDRVEERLRPAVLNQQERNRRPRQQGFCQRQRVSGIEARRALAGCWSREMGAAKRDDSRQEHAKVIVAADDQTLDLAVLVLGDEQQVNQQYSSALDRKSTRLNSSH